MYYLGAIKIELVIGLVLILVFCIALGMFAIHVDKKREKCPRRTMHKRFQDLKK